MKNIKLRIWDNYNSVYCYLNEAKFTANNVSKGSNCKKMQGYLKIGDNDWYTVSKITECIQEPSPIVEFSTGLNDKNDKEVYEGDIIKWWWDAEEDGYCGLGSGGMHLVDHYFEVIFENGSYGFTYDKFRPLYRERYEIVGNINESKEIKTFQQK